ncbi:hypothetical protein CHU92_01545 [Flavobacterium cyanobacteriorum]|uniref:Uncharacterized protein n=1 Tax=Flavobacterium cyanobacteriorum TaxID=2022802 RepID=A0A255ZZL5_9FLAO|nr:hypothetical protein [Flavobacterium cyanobacteriorum]OYQ46335.1 hypothetical protein CHU92_01545 [Flavobacterium cyanobacteriorum]
MKPWIKAGLFFAVWMFFFMTLIGPFLYVLVGLEDKVIFDFSIPKLVISGVASTISGLWIGYNNRNRNKIKSQAGTK